MSKFTSEYNMMEGHTKFQLQLHEEMTAFNDAFNLGKRISVVTPTMNNELYIPYRGGSFYVDNLSQVDYKAVTSDDTKEIERRPYKHLTTTTSENRLKRRRYTLLKLTTLRKQVLQVSFL
ncbi:unnamed protein product [Rhizophagus irregularis]|nr:unnamed protein product [Rhizophagus irregularis]